MKLRYPVPGGIPEPKSPEVAARANGLMRAYLNGRLQAGLDWPEWDEYWDVYRQALRAAAILDKGNAP